MEMDGVGASVHMNGGSGAVLTQNPPYEPKIPLATLVQYFEDAEETSDDARRAAERDRDYVDNKQFTAAELAELKKRGQPDIIINRIKTKVNYMLGYEASQRSDPRGFPRTPQDEDAAEACSDSLRYVADKTDLKMRFSQVWDNMIVEGYGGVELQILPDGNGDGEILVNQWHWDRLFYDPHSREHDFADARYLGGVIWMDHDDAEARWPDKEDVITRTITEDQTRTYSDRPAWKQWSTNGTRKRIRVVQMWHKVGSEWHWCIFTKGGTLEGGVSPYRDEDNKSLCPMILESGYVDRENNRYGFVRALIGPQDEINKRRSKELHILNSNQTIGEDGAVDDVDQVKAEKAKPDGHIVVNPGMRFEFVDQQSQAAGNARLAQEAKNEIDLMGPNASMQGKQNDSASGRAILASQQGGQIEISVLTDRHRHFKQRVYKLIWAMIRSTWTAQKWIRVTDNDQNIKFVGINKPVTLAEDLIKQAEDAGQDVEQVKAMLREQSQNPEVAQQLQQIVRTENVLADMTMDIILDEVPDTANIEQEQFQIMAELGKAGVVQFPPKMWIEMSNLRGKAKLLKGLEDQNKTDPNAEAATQATIEKAMAEIDKLRAEVGKIKAETFDTLIDADIKRGSPGVLSLPAIVAPPDLDGEADEPMPQEMAGQPPQAPQPGMAGAMPPPQPQQFPQGPAPQGQF